MSLAVCPGSFDPITLGHVDVVRRAREMFDEVVIAVAHNPAKRYLFAPEERVGLARAALADLDGVRVALVPGLLARYCADVGAAAIVKGLRGAADFDAEQSMALMNRHLAGVETVFIMGDPTLGHVASSLVKDVASHGGRVDDLVPPAVAAALQQILPRPPSPQESNR
ncbi:pantetheine-phosphate adenylyltransferase [Georgenia sp. SYP-B2076]|uniref:pantetheine-phosphate adenylyltransferase n=1 Tax=Georgenia sp. SYP-B2076 TaxID=2495881 RepID=UPI000F8CF4A7|nr:pantetheine-phosphate adenylyltransferase [Georgenia sp. SYP-B2076]